MRILFIGDIVGRSGRNILLDRMPKLIAEWQLELVVVNGENAAGGFGITEAIYHAFIDAGADAVTLVNTIPGLVIDVDRRRPALGFGGGGVSGAGLLPVGVLATWKIRRALDVPVLGIGGIASAEDALQYLVAGASLVGIGTAALRNPRVPERIVRDLERWCVAHDVEALASIVGSLQWPT